MWENNINSNKFETVPGMSLIPRRTVQVENLVL